MGSVLPCPLLENTLMETKGDVREDIYFISDSGISDASSLLGPDQKKMSDAEHIHGNQEHS